MNYKKVFRSQVKLICNDCNNEIILTDDYIAEEEKRNGMIPLKAKSSSKTIICKCLSTNFRVFHEYHNYYRRRCDKCNEMFETDRSWENTCQPCAKKHVESMVSIGV